MLNHTLRSLYATIAVVVPMILLAAACGEDAPQRPLDDDANPTLPGAGGGTSLPPGTGICLLNNCSSDAECVGCTDGRETCLVEEGRCVSCNPNDGSGCPEGEKCSSFGICAPENLTCPTDERGEPLITCTQNADCLACSPMHQVCDPETSKCTACTEGNTQHCLSSDICVDGKCSPKCPADCASDNDCSQCGGPGNEAHACNAHKCAECSPTFPCAAGLECIQGNCVPGCGIPGPSPGECLANEDCTFCGDPDDATDEWECKKPINQNGPTDRGTCGPQATGCSDLGQGVAVLPAPWNQVTNLCSDDPDCNGVGINLNVGKLIRDLIGSDEIDLGFTEITISDANVSYGMNKCANVGITENLSCGVCVPCEVDSDCSPIQVDPLVGDLFAGEPLAQIAFSLLVDLLWGDNTDHSLHFFCQPVAGGYGVCAPCGNPLQACGQGSGGGGSTGTCSHSVCDQGGALGSNCDPCAASVCQNDPYCCNTAWDATCVSEVALYCGAGVCNGGGGSTSCAHSECSTGAALSASCSTCAGAVCAADSYCCNNQWDSVCVNLVDTECGAGTCSGGGGGGGGGNCAHSVCSIGGALTASCSMCAGAVCAADSFCCNNTWDQTCVDLVAQECAPGTCGGGSSCAHSECASGGKLAASCSNCAASVCAQDSYCCDTTWDSICVDLAENDANCPCGS